MGKILFKNVVFRLFAIALSAAVCFFILEISIRSFFPEYLWKYRDASMDWQLDSKLGWVQKSNLDVTTRTAQGWLVRFQTNQDGLAPATAQRTKNPDVVRIMVFGDSTVVGRAVPQDMTITARMENMLRSIGIPAEVINAGVEGYSTDQALLRIQQIAPHYTPDIIVYGFCSNDFAGNESRSYFGRSKPLFILSANGELVEIAPDLENSKIKPLSSIPVRLIRPLAVFRLFYPKIILLRVKFLGWESRNLLGLTAEIYYQHEELERINRELFAALLKQMADFSRKSGAKFLFYPHPEIGEVWEPFIQSVEKRQGLKSAEYNRYAIENYLRNIAETISIAFCPVIEYFVANKSRGPFHLLPNDPHCNPVGYELTAEVIYQFLLESGFITRMPSDSFIIR